MPLRVGDPAAVKTPFLFFFQAEDGIRDYKVTGVQTCALPIYAEGEFQAAEKMVQAAAMMSKEPIALQLRFLQTMREISSEHNTTTFLPVPIDLFTPFINRGEPPKP